MAHILVVDDERSICELLEITFRKGGHRVEVVTNGEAARRRLVSGIFDIVISDIRLPDISGVEVLAYAKEVSPSSVFLLITGVPTVDNLVAQHLLKTVAAARLMGADCIISGIRPQIAQTMVHLQIDLSAVTTKATMAEALRFALKRKGRATLGNLKNPGSKD